MKVRKGIDGKLDKAWAELVKLRAGNKCEYCGKRSYLNSHHIYSRSKKSTRWDTMNGICLCVGHHTFSSTFSAHKTPLEFTDWLKDYMGGEKLMLLRIKANQTSKLHPFEKKILLEELNKEIKEWK
ncbi:MAG: hypothetical protein GY928_33270 [Colwellia sp.]|nr:hypothetical protein [Colwellia sp.]